MIDPEFTYKFSLDDYPTLKDASIVGICRHNKVRKMVIHHKTHR